MNRRIICFAVCLIMLLTVVLSGCKKNEGSPVETITATTLSMWVVTKNADGVDAETAAIISDAINNITNSKFKVRLVINWLTESEYREKLDQAVYDYIDVRATSGYSSVDLTEDTTVVEAETEINEWGFTVIKYPELIQNQVDIIYIEGEDMYLDYIDNGWLYKMDDDLSGSSKKIKEYVNNALLTAAKRRSGTYAIPNNHAIGQYTVMLLNKALMAETDMDAVYEQGNITNLFNENIYNYLQTVRYKNDANIVPIASDSETFLNLLAHYWDIDPDTLENSGDFSVIGYNYQNKDSLSRSTSLQFNSLFTDEDFVETFLKIKDYEIDGGYFGTPSDTQTAALKIEEMEYADYISYLSDSSEYYPVIIKNPTIESEDVYDSMFGVCAKTVSSTHSMEILTLLNTDAEFRNLIQYGVEGVTYNLVSDPSNPMVKTVEYNTEHPYYMDIFKTGNAFIAYPEPGMNLDIWNQGIKQNLAVSGADPLLDLSFRTIAEATYADDTEITAGSSGLIYTYQGGLSKEILQQNDVLNKWIARCDAAGKSTYCLITMETSMQNVTSLCYFYNNQYDAASSASFDESSGMTVTFEGSSEGYELGLLSIYTRKSTDFKLNAVVNGVVGAHFERHNQVISVDFLQTDTYSVRVSSNIAKTSVATNDIIWNWITTDCTSDAGVPHVLYSVKNVDGINKYTYLVYTTGMENEYTVSASPSGSDTVLNLELNFDESGSALGSDDATYALWLVTVETTSAVTEVNFNIVKDGTAVSPIVTTASEDPSFTYCGTLDSEMVRYIRELNQLISARINACTSLAELKTVTDELSVLLTTHKDLMEVPSKSSFTALSSVVSGLDLEELNYVLMAYTSTSSVKHKALDYNDNGDMITKDITEDPISGEDYVLLDSPYKLYAAWVKGIGKQ